MDLAFLIAVIALIVALPGTIDATWNVIAKFRSLRKDDKTYPNRFPNRMEPKALNRAPFTSSGPGRREMIKPDLLRFGGHGRSTLAHEAGHMSFAPHLKKI